MKRQLTDFQRKYVAFLEDFLGHRETGYKKRLDGKNETYVVLSFESRSRKYEVYVYEDEIGYSEDDSWKIWEVPDYDSKSELFEAFMDDFQTSFEKLSSRGKRW